VAHGGSTREMCAGGDLAESLFRADEAWSWTSIAAFTAYDKS
jgi:hypothetical protein